MGPPSLALPSSHGGTEPPFRIEHAHAGASRSELKLRGSLSLQEASALWSELRKVELAIGGTHLLAIDLSGVASMDGAAMALLANMRARLLARNVHTELLGANPQVQQIVELYSTELEAPSTTRLPARGMLDQVGQATISILHEVQLGLAFVGDLLIATLEVLRSPRRGNFRDLAPTMERTGADAVPIVLLVNFLVGLVMAFQASVQLRRFGANILVADLIGISMTRELGPLMTAIVVCGRSGAAFAAELGTMKVNEEIDALRTLSLSPMRFLVLPRTLALVLVLPLLSVLADAVGVLGGLVVGVFQLDLTLISYARETQKAVDLWDISSGLIKSVAFALAIAMIACQQGFATTGGAEGVGRRTTGAVVTTLFTLIVIDAVFTVFFRVTGR